MRRVRYVAGRVAPCMVMLAVAAGFVFLFSFSTSPFYLGYAGDTSVYKQMGLLILQGGTPYVDLYDNKGILLYLFQALGLWINRHWGIALLQAFMLWATLIVWDKMLQLLHLAWQRIPILLLGLLLLLLFYESGDMTEDLSLLFISIPLYLWIKADVQQTTLTTGAWFAVGLCFGTLVFIRINNALPFCGFYAWTLGTMIVAKQWKEIGRAIGAGIAGLVCVAVPCLLFMAVCYGWGSVGAMLDWMFAKNFSRILFHNDRGADFVRRLPFTPPPSYF